MGAKKGPRDVTEAHTGRTLRLQERPFGNESIQIVLDSGAILVSHTVDVFVVNDHRERNQDSQEKKMNSMILRPQKAPNCKL